MDFERLLACLVAALAVNEIMHIVLETSGVRTKLRGWGKPILWHGLTFIVITGVFFGLFITLDLSLQTTLFAAIFLMTVVFAYTTIAMDAYHAEIGRNLKQSKKD